MTPAASLVLLLLLIAVTVASLAAVEARRQSARDREALGRSRSRVHDLRSERDAYAIRLVAAERERDDYRLVLVEPRVVHSSLRVVSEA